MFAGEDKDAKEWDIAGLVQSLFEIIPFERETIQRENMNKNEFKHDLKGKGFETI